MRDAKIETSLNIFKKIIFKYFILIKTIKKRERKSFITPK